MKLQLTRELSFDDRTIRKLYIDGKYFCDTLEDRERLFYNALNRLTGTKIFGKTAIPTGTYDVVLRYSGRFKKVLPALLDVPQFTGILIHTGNKPEDTEGCILVGTYDHKTKTIAAGTSTPAMKKLMAKLEPASKTGKISIFIH